MRKEINVVPRENRIPALTPMEQAQFDRLQKVIVEDMRAFYRVGLALMEIRDRELYRTTAITFEAYCKKVFDFGKSHSYRLIDAAKVVDNISQTSPNWGQGDADGHVIDMAPINEAHVRPLVRLQPDQQREVWRAVINNSGPRRKVTASLVNGVVRKYLGETTKDTVRVAKEKVEHDPLLGADFKEAFKLFFDQLEKEVANGYKSTAKGVILQHIDQIRAVLTVGDCAWDGNASDAGKLEKAGFNLFRMDKSSMHIKIRSGGGWPNHSGPFETIKEMEQAFTELMRDQKNLRA